MGHSRAAPGGQAPLLLALLLAGLPLAAPRVPAGVQGGFRPHSDRGQRACSESWGDGSGRGAAPGGCERGGWAMRLRGAGSGSGPQVTGLVNLGNTCYFNSVLQNLIHNKPLREEVQRRAGNVEGEGRVTQKLQELLRNVWRDGEGKRRSETPSGLLRALCSVEPQFRGFDQQDSQEVYQALVHAITTEEEERLQDHSEDSEEEKHKHRGKGDTGKKKRPAEPKEVFPGTVFAGKTLSVVTCVQCKHAHEVEERFIDLSLSIPEKYLGSGQTAPPQGMLSGLMERLGRRPSFESFGSRQAPSKRTIQVHGKAGRAGDDEDDEDDEDYDGTSSSQTTTDSAYESSSRMGDGGRKGPRTESQGGGGMCTVEECLQEFVQPELLKMPDGSGIWECTHCAKKVQATKRVRLHELPESLVLHIKRFEVGHHHRVKKATAVVGMSPTLDLAPFLSKKGGHREGGRALYELCGVVNHAGTMGYGHYTAFVLLPEEEEDAKGGERRGDGRRRWAFVSDDHVRDAREEDVLGSSAYLMFYRRLP